MKVQILSAALSIQVCILSLAAKWFYDVYVDARVAQEEQMLYADASNRFQDFPSLLLHSAQEHPFTQFVVRHFLLCIMVAVLYVYRTSAARFASFLLQEIGFDSLADQLDKISSEEVSNKDMPELECDHQEEQVDYDHQVTTRKQQEDDKKLKEINNANQEYADLLRMEEKNEKKIMSDYPDDWMVYDPVFGLVRKKDLGQLKKQQEQKEIGIEKEDEKIQEDREEKFVEHQDLVQNNPPNQPQERSKAGQTKSNKKSKKKRNTNRARNTTTI